MTTEGPYECQECGETFKIRHDGDDDVTFCPFCSEMLEVPPAAGDMTDEDLLGDIYL